jgi:hypothetical protein
MVKRVLALVTQESDSPDVRDRGYMYWRLLSMDPEAAKAIVCSQKPTIQDDTNVIETNLLDELVGNLSNLASVYHKRPSAFVDRKKAAADADDYEEAEEPEEVEASKGGAEAGGASASAVPTMDILSLDPPSPPAARGVGEAGASGTRPAAPRMDVLDDLLGGGSVASSSVSSASAPPGTRPLLSDLLAAPAPPPGGEAGVGGDSAVLLRADQAAGLCLRGSILSRGGAIIYDLHVTNESSTPITGFNLMINKNAYGLQTTALKANDMPAGSTVNLPITLTSDAAKVHVMPPSPTAGGSIAQVAVKTNSGVFYFSDMIPLAAVTVVCKVAQQDWLAQWALMPVSLQSLLLLPVAPPPARLLC